ncbi:unnamed protein product [Rotaria sordida]|uniref:Uncharacterized protein n=1 Tax=Rotaria sordida TaxID=392033 RepID=A0A819KLI5_9BILA|nr:unnamed protein product [Rotaria sordida]CAF3949014.1 unnamed protein product [Rotaria sordida]
MDFNFELSGDINISGNGSSFPVNDLLEENFCDQNQSMNENENINVNSNNNLSSDPMSTTCNFRLLDDWELPTDLDPIPYSQTLMSLLNDFEHSSQYYTNTNNLNYKETTMVPSSINNIQQTNQYPASEYSRNGDLSTPINSIIVNNDNSNHLHSSLQESSEEQTMDTIESNTPTAITEKKYNSKPYPPTSMVGFVEEHYRPYALYGHLNRNALAEQFSFDLHGLKTRKRRQEKKRRLAANMYNIMCRTSSSKNTIMKEIEERFTSTISYVCIGEAGQSTDGKRAVYIQIIFKEKDETKVWFLDDVTRDKNCNYHVTIKDAPWNEFVKRGGRFLEYGLFSSLRSQKPMRWSASPFIRAKNSIPTTANSNIANGFDDIVNSDVDEDNTVDENMAIQNNDLPAQSETINNNEATDSEIIRIG